MFRTAMMLGLLLGGCSSTGSPLDAATAGPPDLATAPDLIAPSYPTVFTIVLENHDYKEVVGSADAPYLNSLIATYGLATNYLDSGTHPSLPNYLYMISGDPQYPGVLDINPTGSAGGVDFPVDQDNLGAQLTKAGIAWRSYQESMGKPCNLQNNSPYAPKHDPFLYFKNIQQGPDMLCATTNVDYSQFPGDLAGGTYRYMWITPNLTSDGHDPTFDPQTGLKNSDAWMMTAVPKILASEVFRRNGILFITWDEAEGHNGNSKDQVPMIVVSPRIVSKGFQSAKPYTHASYLATVEDLFGLPRLGAAQGAPTLMEFLK